MRNLGYARVEYEYDENGNKTAEKYFGPTGMPVRPKARRSAAVKTWEYDDEGRLVSERYYDAEGNLFANTSNYAGIDNWYSEDGTVIETTYVNEYGKTISTWIPAGYCKLRKTYDRSGKPMRGRPGYICTIVYEYDEAGRLIRESTYDENGELAMGTRKYCTIEYAYDEAGARSATYLRLNGSVYK